MAEFGLYLFGKYLIKMELKLELGYEQIWELVKQLPTVQQVKLKKDLEQATTKTSLSDFQKILLNGPVMTDEGFEEVKKTRQQLNKRWTYSLLLLLYLMPTTWLL